MRRGLIAFVAALVLGAIGSAKAADWSLPNQSAGDRMLLEYFKLETAKLASRCLAGINTLDDWTGKRDELRRQLAEMLSLDPWPERTDLAVQVTGVIDHAELRVEKVVFQSRPGLYVTGNLYLPKNQSGPVPGVVYFCGHSRVKKDGISYGNKTHYQYHGAWFAKNGYVCLTIDTLQLGEIEGLHHGTYSEGMWWWNSRGYTPGGVEAWNGIRALDYLASRPEVDPNRLGVTGRSGGGATSWWVAALDERVKVAVPVAGIADLTNHVLDGCVEGHCDCMFIVNTYRWDYGQVAAMVAPRALLIANSDKDPIFPLDGVVRIHGQVKKIYELYGAADKLGLLITEGSHEDTQDLQVPTFHWFHRHLRGNDEPVENTGQSLFTPEELKVLTETPADERNTKIQETFTPVAAPPDESTRSLDPVAHREGLLKLLRERCLAGWPEEAPPLDVLEVASVERDGLKVTHYTFASQEGVRASLMVVSSQKVEKPETVIFEAPTTDAEWNEWAGGFYWGQLASESSDLPVQTRSIDSLDWDARTFADVLESERRALVCIAPRGVGPGRWTADESKMIQIRRRFMLLGQTLAGMHVWDLQRGIAAIGEVPYLAKAPSRVLVCRGPSAIQALIASIFEPRLDKLHISENPNRLVEIPDILNLTRLVNVNNLVGLSAETRPVDILWLTDVFETRSLQDRWPAKLEPITFTPHSARTD